MPRLIAQRALDLGKIPVSLSKVFGYSKLDVDEFKRVQVANGNTIYGIGNFEMQYLARLLARRGLNLGLDVFSKNLLVDDAGFCTLIDLVPGGLIID